MLLNNKNNANVCSTDCKAPTLGFVILGFRNKMDLTLIRHILLFLSTEPLQNIHENLNHLGSVYVHDIQVIQTHFAT